MGLYESLNAHVNRTTKQTKTIETQKPKFGIEDLRSESSRNVVVYVEAYVFVFVFLQNLVHGQPNRAES